MEYFCHRSKANIVHLISYMMQRALLLVMLLCALPTYGEDTYPAICMTTANLNVRTTGSTRGRILETLPSGTKVQVQRITYDGWAEIDYAGRRAYCSAQYLMYWEPVKPLPSASYDRPSDSHGLLSNISSGNIGEILFNVAIICIVLAILRKVLITILGSDQHLLLSDISSYLLPFLLS